MTDSNAWAANYWVEAAEWHAEQIVAFDEVCALFDKAADLIGSYGLWTWGDGEGGSVLLALQERVAPYLPPREPRTGARKQRTKKIAPTTRLRIYERDGYACLHCGTHVSLTIDHIVPVSKGGAHDDDNLQTLCRSCNSRKGAK